MPNHLISKNNQKTESLVKIPKTTIHEGINQIAVDDLYSSNAILISVDNNQILLDKSSDEKIYPASLTKIMTAILAIENLSDLNDRFIFQRICFKDCILRMLLWQVF